MAKMLWITVAFCTLLIPSYGIAIKGDEGLMTLTYSYVGQVLTGVESCDDVFSGLLIECQVKIQHDGSSQQYLMKLQDVTLKKYIGQVKEDPLSIARDADWARLSGDEEEKFISQLNIATVFSKDVYNQIAAIYSTSEEEPEWSLNTKKGILNFFQYVDEPGIYKRNESGIHGHCSVLYNVAESNFEDEVGTKYISKVWDLNSCDDRPKELYVYGIHGFPWKYYRTSNFISSQSQGTFQVSKASILPKRYDELSGEIIGTHVVRPFSDEGKSVVSYTSQKLLFLSQTLEGHLDPNIVYNESRLTGMRMELHGRNPAPEGMSDISEQVNALLGNIVAGLMDDESQEMASSEFMLLVQKLRHISDHELRAVIEQYAGRQQLEMDKLAKQKRDILEDALAIVGSTPASLDIINKIGNNTLVGERAAWLLSALAFTRANAIVLDNLLDVCIYQKEARDLTVASSCYLAFGALVHTACVDVSSKEALANGCSEERKAAYSKALSKVKVGSDERVKEINKILIKASGNAGIHNQKEIAFILSIAMEGSVDIQTQAIYALRRVIPRNASLVLHVLLPIYLDTSLESETRIAACYMLMEAHPRLDVLQLMIGGLRTEHDPQVASFCYSHMKAKLESTYGSYREDAIDALASLGDMEFPILHHSKSYSYASLDWRRKVGFKSYLNALFSPGHSLPTAANFKIVPWMFLYSVNLFEMGMRLDWMSLPDPSSHSFLNNPELDAINQQLGITPEQLKQYIPDLSVYLKAYGNEFRSISGYQVMPLIVQALTQKQEGLKKMFSLGEGRMTVSTDIGIPLSLNLSTAAAVRAQSNVTINVHNFTANLNLSASATMESHLSMQIRDIVQSGVGIRSSVRASLPLDGELGVDRNRTYHLRVKNIKPKHNLIAVKSRPFAFIVRQERKPVGYGSDHSHAKYEVRDLSSEACQGAHVNNESIVLGKRNGVHLNISTSSVIDGQTVVLSGPYEKNITLVSNSSEIQLTFKKANGTLDVEDLLSKMKPNSPHRGGPKNRMSGSRSSGGSKDSSSSESGSGSSSSSRGGSRSSSRSQSGSSSSSRSQSGSSSSSRSQSGSPSSSNGGGSSSSRPSTGSAPHSETGGFLDSLYGFIFGDDGTGEEQLSGDSLEESRSQANDSGSSSGRTSYSGRGRVDGLHDKPGKLVLQAKQYLINFTSIDSVSDVNHTTLMRLVVAQDWFHWAWDLAIFPAVTPTEDLTDQPYRMFCAQSLAEFPNDNSLEENPMVRGKLASQWGRSCADDMKVVHKLKLERAKRDKKTMEHLASLKEQCEQQRAIKGPLSEECLRSMDLEGEMTKGTLEFSHNGVERRYKSLYYSVVKFLVSAYHEQASRNYVDIQNDPDKVLWKWTTLESKNQMNLMIKNPSETINFTRMPLPFELPTYNYNHHHGVIGEKVIGKCKVGYDGQISTFDKVSFGYNLTSCYHVIAEDSTQEQKFALLARSSPVASGKDVLVFLNRTFKIEVKHSASGELEVFVQGVKHLNQPNHVVHLLPNGTVIEEEQGPRDHGLLPGGRRQNRGKSEWDSSSSESEEAEKMTPDEQEYFANLTEIIRDELSQPSEDIESNYLAGKIDSQGGAIEIHSQQMHLLFDGKNIIVKLQPKYHEHTLGLCGSYTGASYERFPGPDGVIYGAGIQAAVAFQNVTEECSQSGCVLELKSVTSHDCKSVSKWPVCSPYCRGHTSVPREILMKCPVGHMTQRVVREEQINTACSP